MRACTRFMMRAHSFSAVAKDGHTVVIEALSATARKPTSEG